MRSYSEAHGKRNRELECGAINQLSSFFSERTFIFLGLRKPPKPDALCRVNGVYLHIEICHIYGTQIDAERIFSGDKRTKHKQNERLLSSQIPIKDKVIDNLNYVLYKKSERSYHSRRVSLLIRSAYPLWQKNDFNNHIESIIIPSKNNFRDIWLLCGPDESCGLLELKQP